MVEFEAGEAAELAAQLGLWQGVGDAVTWRQVQDYVIPLLRKAIAFAEKHELYAKRTMADHLAAIESPTPLGGTPHPIPFACQESSSIFSKSLKDSRIWRMTQIEVRLYDATDPIPVPTEWGDEAAEDGLEAGRCYAASRYTAAGFHAMRLAERIARSLIAEAGLDPDAFYASIDAILAEIRKRLEEDDRRRNAIAQGKPDAMPRLFSPAKVAWLKDYMATFAAVKDAWRNKICHYKICSEVEARELINAARALVRKYSPPSDPVATQP